MNVSKQEYSARTRCHSPTVNLIHEPLSLAFSLRGQPYVLANPSHKVVLKSPLDKLVEEVWSQQLVNVRTWKVVRERLGCDGTISVT